jgi:hypothetical protein
VLKWVYNKEGVMTKLSGNRLKMSDGSVRKFKSSKSGRILRG